MRGRQMWTGVVLIAVFAWSVAMAALGQVAAVITLVPSLGLLVQQVMLALAAAGPAQPGAGVAARDDGERAE